MLYVGIDLAERHSAAVALTEDCEVALERVIDSGPAQPKEHPWERIRAYRKWINDLMGELWFETEDHVALVVEEPYPHAVNVAPSFRIQGAILAELQQIVALREADVLITKSKPWQDHFGYTKKEFGNSKAWAKLMAEGFGYEPGLTLGKTKAKEREDLTDAYLIARWRRETF